MARISTIPQEQGNAAADALVTAGQKPTNRAILDKLGSGSMATVVKLLQNWKAGKGGASATIDEVVYAGVSTDIGNTLEIGRATCRERVCQNLWISVVDVS